MDLRVFDAAGRLVRTLAAGTPYVAGEHGLRWNGLDNRGLALGSGVYLVR